MTSDVIPVLIGGGVTLLGTLLVQLVAVPFVQRRTRGRERWENNMIDLEVAVAQELSRGLNTLTWRAERLIRAVQAAAEAKARFKTATETRNRPFAGEARLAIAEDDEPLVPSMRVDDDTLDFADFDARTFESTVQSAESDYGEALSSVYEIWHGIERLGNVVSRMNHTATFWIVLYGLRMVFRELLAAAERWPRSDTVTFETWKPIEANLRDDRRYLESMIDQMVGKHPMKPPRRYFARRTWLEQRVDAFVVKHMPDIALDDGAESSA